MAASDFLLLGRNATPTLTIVMSATMVVTVLLFWHAQSQGLELAANLDVLTRHVAELNRTIDEMRSGLHGGGGCAEQRKSFEVEKTKYADDVNVVKTKKIEELTASSTKLDENLKKLRTEHGAANVSSTEATAKLSACQQECTDKVNNTIALCKTSKRNVDEKRSKSLFQLLFNS